MKISMCLNTPTFKLSELDGNYGNFTYETVSYWAYLTGTQIPKQYF